jgi:hypothetical protein
MIIGVCGKMRNGKDSIADLLVEKGGYVRYSFADPIKRGAMEMFGFSHEQVFGDLKDATDQRWGITPRKVLQIMGTDLFQFDFYKHMKQTEMVDCHGVQIRRNIWVKRFQIWCEEELRSGRSGPMKIVLPDVRFQHEADGIRDNGGIILKVVRPSITNTSNHPSEVELDAIEPDETIINDGTLEDLGKKLEKTLEIFPS